MRNREFGIWVLIPLIGCAPHRSAQPATVDAAKIRRIAVGPFEGAGSPAVTDQFVQQLLQGGFEVTDGKRPSDAVLQGVVTEYKPSDRLIVFLGKTSLLTAQGQTVVLDDPVVSVSGPESTPEGVALGSANAQVVSVISRVGVVARLLDRPGGRVLWANSYSYEALDSTSAVHAAVAWLAQSLGRMFPKREGPS